MRFVLLFILVFAFTCACSSDDGGSAGSGGFGASGGTGGSSGFGGSGGFGAGGGGKPCSGDSECPGGYCSVAKVCAADGKCAADGDCTAPETCGKGSFMCLAPGACIQNGDCDTSRICEDGACTLGGACGKYEFTKVAPNVMILLDRSCSMTGDAGGDSRWNVAKSAIQTVTQTYDADIRFGLATYSACLPGGCSAGSIVVPIAATNAGAIGGFLADKLDRGSQDGQNQVSGGVQYLCGSGDPETSTGKSLHALVGEGSLQDTTRENAVLLVTDGDESGACVDSGRNGPDGAATLLAQSPSVKTYVVGLGINSASVNAVAQAGGTGQLIPANNQAELTAALDTIASSITACDLALGTIPPDPDKLEVFFNQTTPGIPNDASNGWTYDAATNTVRFHGSTCDQLRDKQVTSIVVAYGCAGVIPT
jgi:hypothetical protein